MEQFDGTENHGRKGIVYDWQAVLASVEAASLDAELAQLTPLTVD